MRRFTRPANVYLEERNREIARKFLQEGTSAIRLSAEYKISRARIYEIVKRQQQIQRRASA